MQMMKKYASEVNSFLEKTNFPKSPENLYSPLDYFLSLGGKRLRPQLVLITCSLFDQNFQKSTPAALAIELFHNFSLIHDDIMDNAPLRRGKETVHEKWNSNIGILSGDMMLIKAYQCLEGLPAEDLKTIFKLFNEVSVLVCEGQQLDMDYENESSVSVDEYINMIYLKTSVLIEYAMDMGAFLGGANQTQRNLIKEFGKNLGIAFQLKDDLLDVYGDSAQVGKQKGGDIISNKKTFLLLSALEKANSSQKEELNKWISQIEINNTEKVKSVTNIFNEIGIKELTENKILEYYEKAKVNLESLQCKFSENKIHLENLMNQLHSRKF